MKRLIFIFVLFATSLNAQDPIRKVKDSIKPELYKTQISIDESIMSQDYSSGLQVHHIVLDYETKKAFKIPEKIKEGDFYQIYVSNINLNRYKIAINSKDSVYQVTPLTMPTFSSISLDALTSLTSSFDVSASFVESLDKSDSLGIKNNGIDEPLDDLKLIEKLNNYKLNEFQKIKIVNEFFLIQSRLNLIQNINHLNEIQFEIEKARLLKVKDEYGGSSSFDAINSLSKIQNLRDTIYNNILSLQVNFNLYKEDLTEPEVAVYLADSNNKPEKLQSELISKAYKELIEKNNKLAEQIAEDKMYEVLKSLIYMKRPNYFKSFPIQFTGDYNEVTVTKTPRDTTGILDSETIRFKLPIHNDKQYWSVGTSFYYSNLKNDRFSFVGTQVNDSLVEYRAVDEGRTSGEVGVAVNLRGGYKFENDFGVHLAIGPGVSIEKDVRPRLLTGIGLSFGKKHNVVLDFGAIIGYVERRSATLDLETIYTVLPENSTVTELKMTHYFSLGYTFNL